MKYKKLKSNDQKGSKQAEAKRDGVINLHNYDFNPFYYGKFWCSQKGCISIFPIPHKIGLFILRALYEMDSWGNMMGIVVIPLMF